MTRLVTAETEIFKNFGQPGRADMSEPIYRGHALRQLRRTSRGVKIVTKAKAADCIEPKLKGISLMFDRLPLTLAATCRTGLLFAATVLLCTVANYLFANDEQPLPSPSPAQIEHFEKHIRPLLHKRCYSCHSAEATVLQGGLRVDGGSHLLAGGDSGAAIVAGKPDDSLLVQSIRYLGDGYDMPPDGKLPDAEIALLVDWVASGAVFPGNEVAGIVARSKIDWDEGRKFWSFQPLARRQPPQPSQEDQSDGDIDRFVLAKLKKRGLSQSPAADRATLIRRVSFNLTGLPPTPDEIARFVGDQSPQAYETLIDQLLASPYYGERWGRMWLDLARYADTTESWLGSTPNSHLYRDWVVRALNEDMPYDEFVRRQLATDSIGPEEYEHLPALGFLGLSPTYFKELLLPPEIIKVLVADEWEERVDAVSRTFLGLTVACARCHDHKFDPISNEDYYALAGVFASTRMTDRPMIPADQYAPVDAAKKKIAELSDQLTKLRKQNPKPESEIKAIESEIAEIKSTTANFETPLANVVTDESLHVVLAGEDPQSGSKLDYRAEPQDLQVAIRGNPNKLGELVPRRFITVLSSQQPRSLDHGSGRKDLADAILDEAGPLAARVIVNRIWLAHFGRGLVETPSNFGLLGDAPSHPELLEDLTARFVENGWSIKWLHREILRSHTYRQSSEYDEANYAVDPDNRWLWRMNRKRLDIEPWRDAMLAVSGQLDSSIGGPSLAADSDTNLRRTIYTTIHRRELSKMLQLHDFPDPSLHSPQRLDTSTPLQGLFVLNSRFVISRAEALADRLLRELPHDTGARVQQAYQWLFGRAASDDEVQLASAYLHEVAQECGEENPALATASAWKLYLHALLGSNELLFVD